MTWKDHVTLISKNEVFAYYGCGYCEDIFGVRIHRSFHVSDMPFKYMKNNRNKEDIAFIKKHIKDNH